MEDRGGKLLDCFLNKYPKKVKIAPCWFSGRGFMRNNLFRLLAVLRI